MKDPNLPDDCQPGSRNWRNAPWNNEDPQEEAERRGLRLCGRLGCERVAPPEHFWRDSCPACYFSIVEGWFIGPDAIDEDAAKRIHKNCAICMEEMDLLALHDHVDKVHASTVVDIFDDDEPYDPREDR
jgi:hypothetical protein